MRKIFFLAVTFFALNHTVLGQIGGKRSFEFLELPGGAKTAAIGGVNVSSGSHDVTMLYSNPALLNSESDYQLFFGHNDFLADIRQNNLTFSLPNKKKNHWAAGVQYINYGDFIERDASGNEIGKFSVADYSVNLTHAATVDHFTLGVTGKVAVSHIAEYKAAAAFVDVGGIFKHPKKDLTVGLVLKNVGYQYKTYNDGDRDPMPFDAQLGLSYKLEHMPLKFSLTAHHLYQFDIVYQDSTLKGKLDENNEEIKPKKTFADKALRHFVVGGEFLLSKNFNVRFGYNHLKRRELRTETKAGGAGLSFGAMIRIKNFELNYTRAYYHVSGATNYFTVSTSLSRWLKKDA
jgi:hypothetical protein